MNRLGALVDSGSDKRKVVEVPRDSKASPGADRETTVAGLSPVNGAIMQS